MCRAWKIWPQGIYGCKELFVVLGSGTSKGAGVHFIIPALVNTHLLAAGTGNPTLLFQAFKPFGYPALVAAKDIPGTHLSIFKKFSFTTGTLDGQHAFSYIHILSHLQAERTSPCAYTQTEFRQ